MITFSIAREKKSPTRRHFVFGSAIKINQKIHSLKNHHDSLLSVILLWAGDAAEEKCQKPCMASEEENHSGRFCPLFEQRRRADEGGVRGKKFLTAAQPEAQNMWRFPRQSVTSLSSVIILPLAEHTCRFFPSLLNLSLSLSLSLTHTHAHVRVVFVLTWSPLNT